MLPECALAAFAVLEAEGLLMRAGGEGFVLLAAGAGGGVNAFKLGDRERRFGGVFAGVVRVKVRKARLFILSCAMIRPICNPQSPRWISPIT